MLCPVINRGEGLAKKAWLLIEQHGTKFLVRGHVCNSCAKIYFAEPGDEEIVTGKAEISESLLEALASAKKAGGEIEERFLKELSEIITSQQKVF